MNQFLIVSYAIHKQCGGRVYSYAPYVREMNLWIKHVDKVCVIAPIVAISPDPLDMAYDHEDIKFINIPELDFTSIGKALKSVFMMPLIVWVLLRQMKKAGHIHLRCPGNVGLLGVWVQFFFPQKPKTVKYANNWDPRSKQPFSYRLQKYLLRSSWFCRRTKVLVYGDWAERSKNIVPFYTASYTQSDKLPVELRILKLREPLFLLFVGTLTPNKRPLTAIKTVVELKKMGVDSILTMIGAGNQCQYLKEYAHTEGVSDSVVFTGKLEPSEVIPYFKQSHFLVFMSWSEGWPKVVAEAMWWGCVPVSTDVSCVKSMLGGGARGLIIHPDAIDVAEAIIALISEPMRYEQIAAAGIEWSRQYHLDRFEKDISELIVF